MSKIVLMDSGFGGLTVLSELIKSMPNEEYVFYGDSAHAPYGEKTHDELLERTEAICDEMISRYEVKCFVTACNTTSSEVWDELTERYKDYDFIGIEPALKAAVREHTGGRILVLATTATTKGRRLRARYEELKSKADISLLAAPGIVPFVENLKQGRKEFKVYLEELLASYIGNTDCVVLGCTHFPFVKEELKRVLGENVVFYDAAKNVAEALKVLTGNETDMSKKRAQRFNVPVHIHEGDREFPTDNAEKKFNQRSADIIFLNSDPRKAAKEQELLKMYLDS